MGRHRWFICLLLFSLVTLLWFISNIRLQEEASATALRYTTHKTSLQHEPMEHIRSNLEFISLIERRGEYNMKIMNRKLLYRNTTVPVWYEDFDGPLNTSGARPGRITVRFDGRLGNNLYQYCALYATAARYGMQIVVSKDCILAKVFRLNATLVSDARPGRYWAPFIELNSHDYDPRIEHLDFRRDVELIGAFREFHYWDNMRTRVLRQFRFADEVEAKAVQFLRKVYKESEKPHNNIVLIGVHIRRTDLVKRYNRLGRELFSEKYLLAARQYMEKQFVSKTLVFVVCSDDLVWARENFPVGDHQVAFSENHVGVDFAIISKTNHTIITIGTFGRWAAYLCGGITVYYDSNLKAEVYEPLYSRDRNADVHWKAMPDTQ